GQGGQQGAAQQGAQQRSTTQQGATPQAGAQQGGAAGQQGATQQQGANGQPVIVVQGNPDAAPGAAPPGGNFQFFGGPGGPGGPGGNFQPPPGGFRGPPGGFGGGGFGGGGFGGFGGGGGQGGAPRGGRLNFSVYHTWVLESSTQLAPGLPVIDQLNGGTLGGGAGPSQHQLQFQAGYTQSGLGFRAFANWN
ncbi:MAG: TonB-dependent receptor, partial [Sphingobium sp.]|nr:TonB-dependent receptor [Sphingobium sp.]